MNEKFEEKKGKTQNYEISHIDRLTLEPRIYKGNQNIFILSMCEAQSVQGDLSKIVCTRPRGRLWRTRVYTAAWMFTSGRVDVYGRTRVYTTTWTFYRIIRSHATKSKACN